jgi:hypothetical protein
MASSIGSIQNNLTDYLFYSEILDLMFDKEQTVKIKVLVKNEIIDQEMPLIDLM